MAIRPEDVRVGKTADGVNCVRGRVELVEYLGREKEAVVSIDGGHRIWIRSADNLAPGDQIDLTLPPDKLVLLPRG